MADTRDRRDTDPFRLVQEVLEAPGEAAGSVPALLALLDDENPTIRLAGSFTLCVIANADPESVPGIATRLYDRLDSDSRAETMIAYNYLASQYPRRVDEALRDGDASGTAPGGAVDADTDREQVGRVRPPGVGSYDPHSVDPDRNVIDPADPQRHPDGEVPDIRSDGPEQAQSDDEPPATEFQPGPTERQQWNRLYERLSEIVGHSRFDDLMVLSGKTRDRYADIARVLAVEGNTERALALRLFHRPSQDREAFAADIDQALTQWQAIGEHPHVVSVFDIGTRPRPWAATEPIVETLADRGERFDPAAAVSVATDLADALAYAHQHGVIHAGLDPENVALPTTERGVPSTGRLDNVALLGVYRWYVTPATCLDPRYAAPEYYDRKFGRVNHATDVYHLGAVLYRLLTGRPPFDGPFDEIRERVINADPPEPSAAVGVPTALDRIVTKAMGKRTLRRYETINDLRGDLDRVYEELTTDGE